MTGGLPEAKHAAASAGIGASHRKRSMRALRGSNRQPNSVAIGAIRATRGNQDMNKAEVMAKRLSLGARVQPAAAQVAFPVSFRLVTQKLPRQGRRSRGCATRGC